MHASIHRIEEIQAKFDAIPTEKDHARMSALRGIERAPGSGISGDATAHHQGIFKLDGEGNYIITGNVKNSEKGSHDHPYFYVIRNGVGAKCFGGKDYYSIIVDSDDSRKYTHPSGIQVCENVLAMVMENYGDKKNTLMRFYDISGIPEQGGGSAAVNELSGWSFHRSAEEGKECKGEAVGLVKRNDQWILAVQSGEFIEVYLCDSDQAGEGHFVSLGKLECSKENKLREYQNINLYMDSKDDVYMFGMPFSYGDTDDKCAMHKLHFCTKDGKITGLDWKNPVIHLVDKHFHRPKAGPRFCFAASVYPKDGALRIFSIEAHVEDNAIAICEWA